MNKKIIFRADGNANTGLGHMYRLFAIIEMIKDTYDYIFLTREMSNIEIIPEAYHRSIIPKEINIKEEPAWLASKFSPSEHVLFADGYQFDTSYQKEIKNAGYKMIYVDDLTSEYMYADAVINHSPLLTTSNFKGERYTNYYLGTDYAILRPSFLEATKRKRNITSFDKAFICFGGADTYDFSTKAAEALITFAVIKEIHIVQGAANRHDSLEGLANNHQDHVFLHKNLNETQFVDLISNCNIAIAPASTVLYELCCIQVPVLSGFFIDNQELIYNGFKNNKAIYPMGDLKGFTSATFKSYLRAFFEQDDFEEMLTAQHQLFDINIKKRHLKIIESLCQP
ncbi:UDP-2,4-diacetamido-2,4,6-trideoxy-beta-L-altropyranose hydrolase [Sungkyunkwania multivorans]|uniref:UDP-2,4-diacetamido-2,4, 6-trideoxy-beta-L-altropyranose hydrolase n=1 Tax=Sungkyunkwania multivorans TaxID=1173618 RepID=A0ABW3D2D1_9FLAO